MNPAHPTLTLMTALEVMQVMHPGEGAIIGSWRKDATGFKNLGGFDSPGAGLLELLQQPDCYFTVNSTYAQRTHRFSDETNLPLYSRRERALRYLNAIVLDLDCHDGEFCFEDAFQVFIAEVESQGLAWPSLVCSSGRGLWGLWLLCDRLNTDQPPAAHPDIRRIFKRIGRAVARRFAHLGADPRCHDGSRLMRVPGSTNSSARPGNEIVKFYRLAGSRYSLPELGSYFNVKASKTAIRPDGPRSERHVVAGRCRWSVPLEGIRLLEKMRHGFGKGVRRTALWALAVLLRKNRVPEHEIISECSEVAARCHPPCGEKDVADALKGSLSIKGRVGHNTFAEMLQINQQEKAALCFWFREYRKTKAQAIADRRAIVARELAIRPGCSWRELARILRDRYSIQVTNPTVGSDIKALKKAKKKSLQRQEWAPEFAPMAIAAAGQEQGAAGRMYV